MKALAQEGPLLARVLDEAKQLGLDVRFGDLGRWTTVAIFAEYEHRTRRITLDVRTMNRLLEYDRAIAIRCAAAAVAHEISHAREAAAESKNMLSKENRRRAEDRAHAYVRERYGIDHTEVERAIRVAFRA